MKTDSHLWFKRKRYGWGWTPARKEGWYALGLCTVVVAVAMSRIQHVASSGGVLLQVVLPIFGASVALVALCYKKGETPRWQWGEGGDE